jgi:hypothetical protein
LELLLEYYQTHPERTHTDWLKPAERTWEGDRDYWKEAISKKGEALLGDSHVMWINSFAATCTDASEQRYLKVLPGERIECEINYTHAETKSTCIIQFQMAIDFEHPVANISQICSSREHQAKSFALTAPSTPGIYMIWSKCCYHYSFAQAEETYPADYGGCESWYSTFVAWVRVDPAATPRPRGKLATWGDVEEVGRAEVLLGHVGESNEKQQTSRTAEPPPTTTADRQTNQKMKTII